MLPWQTMINWNKKLHPRWIEILLLWKIIKINKPQFLTFLEKYAWTRLSGPVPKPKLLYFCHVKLFGADFFYLYQWWWQSHLFSIHFFSHSLSHNFAIRLISHRSIISRSSLGHLLVISQ